ISAVALNSATITAARRMGRDLHKEIRQCQYSVVLVSPERLTSQEFDPILRDEDFMKNWMVMGIDEVHVLVPWGRDFRKAYYRTYSVWKRAPSHTRLVTGTATLTPGNDTSARPNVRTMIHELGHSLDGFNFPEILWAIEDGQKAVLYAVSIDLGFRLAIYLWHNMAPGAKRLVRVRIWNSLMSSEHNAETLRLFRDDPECCVIIATIAFGMGMNVRNIKTVGNVGLPTSYSAKKQQDGRAGR
ncbi:hypothetical protein PLICRDRAFT_64754, partial [Plicaturopsis crispa FD-325 SS-3]